MQYMLLIYDDADAGEREGLMQEYFAYTDELEASGKLVSSAPLHPAPPRSRCACARARSA